MGSKGDGHASAGARTESGPGAPPEERAPRKPRGDQGEDGEPERKPSTQAPPPAAPAGPDADALSKQLEEAKERVAALQKALDETKKERLYVQAEFDNFRKQKLREFEDMRRYAAERVVATLIDDLENLQRLEEHAASELKEVEAAGADAGVVGKFRLVFEGVQRVTKHLSEALAATGLVEMSAAGAIFDPTLHEALAEEIRPDCKDREILRVFQKGYTMHGRVLRPAKVLVGRRVEKPPEEAPASAGARERRVQESQSKQ